RLFVPRSTIPTPNRLEFQAMPPLLSSTNGERLPAEFEERSFRGASFFSSSPPSPPVNRPASRHWLAEWGVISALFSSVIRTSTQRDGLRESPGLCYKTHRLRLDPERNRLILSNSLVNRRPAS